MEGKALLAVSFGTTHEATLEKNIAAIERDLAAAFPERTLRRAFTSGMVLRRWKKERGVEIDDGPAALERLETYQWIAFTSPVGGQVFFDALNGQGKDSRALAGVKLAAIGPGTAAALKKYGLTADYVPAVYSAQDLGQGIPATGKVLLPRAQEGSPLLTQALTQRGISYEELAVYTTHYDNPRSPELREALEAGELSYVTFTSASTVKGFVASVGEDAPLGNITGLCIGAQTAQ